MRGGCCYCIWSWSQASFVDMSGFRLKGNAGCGCVTHATRVFALCAPLQKGACQGIRQVKDGLLTFPGPRTEDMSCNRLGGLCHPSTPPLSTLAMWALCAVSWQPASTHWYFLLLLIPCRPSSHSVAGELQQIKPLSNSCGHISMLRGSSNMLHQS